MSLQLVGLTSVFAQQPLNNIPITLDYPTRIAINQIASYDAADLHLRFVNVTEDSRCPSDVQCVWEGQVTISLEATRSSDSGSDNFSLTIGPDNELSTRKVDGHLVRLVGVEPYPVSTEPILPSEYMATLIIHNSDNAGGASDSIYSSVPVALDETGRPAQSFKVGDHISVSSAIQSKFDDDRTFVAVIEARSTKDGITRFLAVSNSTATANSWVELNVPWNPKEPGEYQFRIFLVDGFDSPQVLSAVRNSNVMVTIDGGETDTSNSTSVIDGNNRFALDLYSELSADPELDDNIFYSPWSISTAFALVHEGARGQTADEIQALFHFPGGDAKRMLFASAQDRLNENQGNYTLRTANALWIKDGYLLSDEYLGIARDFYRSNVSNVDIPSEAARLLINEWVESKTNDKILNLIPQGTLDSDTRLVITNAIYFKGNWTTQFDKDDTHEEEFKVGRDMSVRVPMMNLQEKDFRYAENDELQILELPYQGNEVSMLVLLPKDNNGLQDLEKSLSLENLAAWKSSLLNQTINVSIPKFKLETMYGLNGVLSAMGMPTAFNADLADLSGITEEEQLFIQAALHKAFVEVNEEGTEAAAATGVVVGTTSLREYPVFKADHPFIFIIQDTETDNILFIGRVANPTD